MENFIYVFTNDAKEALLERGYTLLKEDPARGVYVFANEMAQTFTSNEFLFVLSNSMTF